MMEIIEKFYVVKLELNLIVIQIICMLIKFPKVIVFNLRKSKMLIKVLFSSKSQYMFRSGKIIFIKFISYFFY